MAGKYLRGAFVSFTPGFLKLQPSVIAFQYNPEKMTHEWTERSVKIKSATQALSVAGNPEESFSFTLKLEADPKSLLATVSGLHSQLAALETLRFPIESKGKVPRFQLPLVLFVWGPGRIVPVRVERLSISETLYDALLNPTQADVDIDVRALNEDEVKALPANAMSIAETVMDYSKDVRKVLLSGITDVADKIASSLW